MKKHIYTILFMLAAFGTVNAQFNWQGVLRDGDNAPVANQSVSVQITIMQNGSAVMQETHSVTSNDVGIMTVEVCNGTNVSGDCASIDWSTNDYMLNVAVDENGGSNYSDYGSSPIMMVPMASYAMNANNANTAAVADTSMKDAVDDADADPTNELQTLYFDAMNRRLAISGSTDTINIPSTGRDADPDPTNEVQQLSKNNLGEIVLTRNSGFITDGKVTDEVDDADADPTNEIQELALNGTELSIDGANSVDLSGLGGGGAGIWTKQNQNIFYQTGVPNNRIEFGPGKFDVGLGGTQYVNITGGSNRMIDEMAFTTPNSGKQHAIGRYIQDFPVPDRSQFFCRLDEDTTFLVQTNNFTNEVSATMTLAGNVQNTRVIGFQMGTQGGFGSFVQTVGNVVGARMGILTGGVPFVGISAANNPNQIVSFMDRNRIAAPMKNFVIPHPEDASKQIWYACIEGPEAAAYERGTAQLVNGEAFIPFSEHFELVINAETMTVNLTPNSAESLGLAVVEKTAEGIRVKELYKGTGNYSFDWEAKAVRKGYENYRAIRDVKDTQIQESINLD